MVEVDPKLFVTCRLCLEVEGQFQIVPSVQQQIKYCFDIHVEPFDCLPQLICKKCEGILKEYYKIKKNFLEKQEEIKIKVQQNAKQAHISHSIVEDVSDSHTDNNSVVRKKKHKSKKVRKRIVNRLMSSSCDELDYNDDDDSVSKINQNHYTSNEEPEPLKNRLCKYYVCRICSQRFRHKGDTTEHMNEHKGLLKEYENIFRARSLVVLDRVECKSNVVYNNNTVIYDSNSIIEQNKHYPNYYIVYNPKKCSASNKHESRIKRFLNHSESTDDEILSGKRKRILSRSSSDTVVINRHSENEEDDVSKNNNITPNVIDIIDINDSSDNDSYESFDKNNISTDCKNDESNNLKSVHDIVKMCYNRYMKKQNSSEDKRLPNDKIKVCILQHKVLSFGIKIINNKGFNCTGILRYTEYKDLNVIWKETRFFNAGNNTKYVRISTKMKNNDGNNAHKNERWEVFKELNYNHFYKLKKRNNFFKKLNELKIFAKTRKIKVNEEKNHESIDYLPRISSVYSNSDLEIAKSKTVDTDSHLQKLLNTNPVSNPKQLPKKFSESCIKITKVFSGPNQILPCFDVNQLDENPMPIVTSSVSLLPAGENEAENNIVANDDSVNSSLNKPQTVHPRIKVKSVSELMPEKTKSPINTEYIFPNKIQNVLTCNNTSTDNDKMSNKVLIPNVMSTGRIVPFNEQQTYQTYQVNNNATLVSNTSNVAREYVWLHTRELPNTRTDSPFQYVRNLLLIHNITLLDSDESVVQNSVILVKLNVAYNQDQCRPLSVSLILLCSRNIFCIKVKDERHNDVIISQLSANWQWLLLNVYNKDVANEVLKSAAKVDVATLRNTQTFINLINSIHCSQENRHLD